MISWQLIISRKSDTCNEPEQPTTTTTTRADEERKMLRPEGEEANGVLSAPFSHLPATANHITRP
jgi:hypothetical protein